MAQHELWARDTIKFNTTADATLYDVKQIEIKQTGDTEASTIWYKTYPINLSLTNSSYIGSYFLRVIGWPGYPSGQGTQTRYIAENTDVTAGTTAYHMMGATLSLSYSPKAEENSPWDITEVAAPTMTRNGKNITITNDRTYDVVLYFADYANPKIAQPYGYRDEVTLEPGETFSHEGDANTTYYAIFSTMASATHYVYNCKATLTNINRDYDTVTSGNRYTNTFELNDDSYNVSIEGGIASSTPVTQWVDSLPSSESIPNYTPTPTISFINATGRPAGASESYNNDWIEGRNQTLTLRATNTVTSTITVSITAHWSDNTTTTETKTINFNTSIPDHSAFNFTLQSGDNFIRWYETSAVAVADGLLPSVAQNNVWGHNTAAYWQLSSFDIYSTSGFSAGSRVQSIKVYGKNLNESGDHKAHLTVDCYVSLSTYTDTNEYANICTTSVVLTPSQEILPSSHDIEISLQDIRSKPIWGAIVKAWIQKDGYDSSSITQTVIGDVDHDGDHQTDAPVNFAIVANSFTTGSGTCTITLDNPNGFAVYPVVDAITYLNNNVTESHSDILSHMSDTTIRANATNVTFNIPSFSSYIWGIVLKVHFTASGREDSTEVQDSAGDTTGTNHILLIDRDDVNWNRNGYNPHYTNITYNPSTQQESSVNGPNVTLSYNIYNEELVTIKPYVVLDAHQQNGTWVNLYSGNPTVGAPSYAPITIPSGQSYDFTYTVVSGDYYEYRVSARYQAWGYTDSDSCTKTAGIDWQNPTATCTNTFNYPQSNIWITMSNPNPVPLQLYFRINVYENNDSTGFVILNQRVVTLAANGNDTWNLTVPDNKVVWGANLLITAFSTVYPEAASPNGYVINSDYGDIGVDHKLIEPTLSCSSTFVPIKPNFVDTSQYTVTATNNNPYITPTVAYNYYYYYENNTTSRILAGTSNNSDCLVLVVEMTGYQGRVVWGVGMVAQFQHAGYTDSDITTEFLLGTKGKHTLSEPVVTLGTGGYFPCPAGSIPIKITNNNLDYAILDYRYRLYNIQGAGSWVPSSGYSTTSVGSGATYSLDISTNETIHGIEIEAMLGVPSPVSSTYNYSYASVEADVDFGDTESTNYPKKRTSPLVGITSFSAGYSPTITFTIRNRDLDSSTCQYRISKVTNTTGPTVVQDWVSWIDPNTSNPNIDGRTTKTVTYTFTNIGDYIWGVKVEAKMYKDGWYTSDIGSATDGDTEPQNRTLTNPESWGVTFREGQGVRSEVSVINTNDVDVTLHWDAHGYYGYNSSTSQYQTQYYWDSFILDDQERYIYLQDNNYYIYGYTVDCWVSKDGYTSSSSTRIATLGITTVQSLSRPKISFSRAYQRNADYYIEIKVENENPTAVTFTYEYLMYDANLYEKREENLTESIDANSEKLISVGGWADHQPVYLNVYGVFSTTHPMYAGTSNKIFTWGTVPTPTYTLHINTVDSQYLGTYSVTCNGATLSDGDTIAPGDALTISYSNKSTVTGAWEDVTDITARNVKWDERDRSVIATITNNESRSIPVTISGGGNVNTTLASGGTYPYSGTASRKPAFISVSYAHGTWQRTITSYPSSSSQTGLENGKVAHSDVTVTFTGSISQVIEPDTSFPAGSKSFAVTDVTPASYRLHIATVDSQYLGTYGVYRNGVQLGDNAKIYVGDVLTSSYTNKAEVKDSAACIETTNLSHTSATYNSNTRAALVSATNNTGHALHFVYIDYGITGEAPILVGTVNNGGSMVDGNLHRADSKPNSVIWTYDDGDWTNWYYVYSTTVSSNQETVTNQDVTFTFTGSYSRVRRTGAAERGPGSYSLTYTDITPTIDMNIDHYLTDMYWQDNSDDANDMYDLYITVYNPNDSYATIVIYADDSYYGNRQVDTVHLYAGDASRRNAVDYYNNGYPGDPVTFTLTITCKGITKTLSKEYTNIPWR